MRYLVLTLLFAAPAMAQEPSAWPESVTTAFFADAEFTTLRPPEDIAANWALLTDADRELVERDCAAPNLGEAPALVREVCAALP